MVLDTKIRSKIGFVVGLKAEANLLKGTGFTVEIGGGTAAGAAAAARRLLQKDIAALISFGIAGGLNPRILPGKILIPECVVENGEVFPCDFQLAGFLGGANIRSVIATDGIVATADEKRRLFQHEGADAVDLESGSVARAAAAAKLPFAVLRAVADPARRELPPAALIALSASGAIKISPVLASVVRRPTQIPALLAIARDAAKAQAALRKQVRARFF